MTHITIFNKKYNLFNSVELDLNHKEISFLPVEFANLINLKFLSLHTNVLNSLQNHLVGNYFFE